jgi:hypothetical protein
MRIFGSLTFEIAAVILISTTHLRKSSGPIAKSVSSALLLVLIALVIDSKSGHLCDEGRAPFFVKFGFGAIGGALPWVLPSSPWITRGAIIPIILFGAFVASFLTASYHRDDITGNRDFSSGFFWHTPFTGQYPRGPGMTFEQRRAEMQRIIHEIEEREHPDELEARKK